MYPQKKEAFPRLPQPSGAPHHHNQAIGVPQLPPRNPMRMAYLGREAPPVQMERLGINDEALQSSTERVNTLSEGTAYKSHLPMQKSILPPLSMHPNSNISKRLEMETNSSNAARKVLAPTEAGTGQDNLASKIGQSSSLPVKGSAQSAYKSSHTSGSYFNQSAQSPHIEESRQQSRWQPSQIQPLKVRTTKPTKHSSQNKVQESSQQPKKPEKQWPPLSSIGAAKPTYSSPTARKPAERQELSPRVSQQTAAPTASKSPSQPQATPSRIPKIPGSVTAARERLRLGQRDLPRPSSRLLLNTTQTPAPETRLVRTPPAEQPTVRQRRDKSPLSISIPASSRQSSISAIRESTATAQHRRHGTLISPVDCEFLKQQIEKATPQQPQESSSVYSSSSVAAPVLFRPLSAASCPPRAPSALYNRSSLPLQTIT